MTGSSKVYSAPRLDSLDLRSTQDIDITLGIGGTITIPTPAMGS